MPKFEILRKSSVKLAKSESQFLKLAKRIRKIGKISNFWRYFAIFKIAKKSSVKLAKSSIFGHIIRNLYAEIWPKMHEKSWVHEPVGQIKKSYL